MKNCPVCKEQIPEEAKFCPVCGIKLPEEAAIVLEAEEIQPEPELVPEEAEPVEEASVPETAEPVEEALAPEEAEPVEEAPVPETAEPVEEALVPEEAEPVEEAPVPETAELVEAPVFIPETEETQTDLGELHPDQAEIEIDSDLEPEEKMELHPEERMDLSPKQELENQLGSGQPEMPEPDGGFFTYTSSTFTPDHAVSPETSQPYEYAENSNDGVHVELNENEDVHTETPEHAAYEAKKPMSSMDYARQTYGSIHQTEENPYEGPIGNPNVEILNAKQGENTINSTPYLVCSILATILSALCCCGIPFGIVAIVYAAQIDGKLRDGRFEEAKKAADNSKIFAIIAAATFVVIYGFIIFSIIFGTIMW